MQQSALNTLAAAPDGHQGAWWHLLRRLASLRLTLLLLVMLAVAIVVAYRGELGGNGLLAVPLTLLAINVLAAVAGNEVFRRQLPLLVFHLSLVVVLLLVAAGRLTYLKGQVELSDGETFSGELSQREAGPWHRGDLERLRFVNRGFEVAYSRGLQRDETRNRVAWPGPDGRWREAEIGDQEPLRLAGYRFYTSFNKGFAPAFQWQPAGGAALFGTVHLPAYPLHQYRQARTWMPPGAATPVWVMLQFDEVLIDPQRPSAFRLPDAYELVVRLGDERHTLRPGESIRLPGGVLTFAGLKTWMGYTVFYDWTLPWLFAASLVAVASLAVHFWRRCAARPWDAQP